MGLTALLLALSACDPKDGSPAADTDLRDTAPADTGPLDADGDGAVAGEDCDDGNPWVYPGATEWCDPIDHDCDGEALAPGVCGNTQLMDALWTTSWLPQEDWPGDAFGAAIGSVGDLDGDGAAEWIGSCGYLCTRGEYGENANTALLFHGGEEGRDQRIDLETMTWFSSSDGCDYWMGFHPADIGDANGDGLRDLALLTRDLDGCVGRVWLLYGPGDDWGPRTDVYSASDVTWNSYSDSAFGNNGLVAGDFDGDGLSDMVVGAPGAGEENAQANRTWVLPGAADLDPSQLLDDEPWTQGEELYGHFLHASGDLDGDGLDELVTGDYMRRYVLSGADVMDAQGARAEDLAVEVLDTQPYILDCAANLGDLDGDGLPELALGDSSADDRRGAIYVLSGLDPGLVGVSVAEAARGAWVGAEANQEVGGECWRTDLDGDGTPELAYYDGLDASTTFFRLDQGIPAPATPILGGYRIGGDHDLSYRVLSVSGFGDFTGDGRDDVNLLGYEEVPGDDRTGTALIAGWDIPWDEEVYW